METAEVKFTKAQMDCIQYPANKDLAIRGVVGSGKTTVLMERAIRLRNEALATGKRGKVAIFTYNQALAWYIKSAMPDEIEVSTLTTAISALHQKVCGHTGQAIENKMQEDLLSQIKEEYFTSHMGEYKVKLQEEKYNRPLLDELSWMRQHHICTEEEYLKVRRYGRESFKLTKGEKRYVFDLYIDYFTRMDLSSCYVEDLYNELWDQRKKLTKENRYDYILVDDIQDMSINRIKILKCICNYGVTITCDYAQKLYAQGCSWKELKMDMTKDSVKTLTQCFRGSEEILNLATHVLDKNRLVHAEEGVFITPEFPKPSNHLPIMYAYDTEDEEFIGIVTQVKKLMGRHPNDTIAVLAPRNANKERIRKLLYKNGVPAQMIDADYPYDFKPGIKVATFQAIKGLTFDHVICINLVKSYLPGKAGNEMAALKQDAMDTAAISVYEGMTRAKQSLIMTYSREKGKASFLPKKYMKEIRVAESSDDRSSMMKRLSLGCPIAMDIQKLIGYRVKNQLRGLGTILDTNTKKKTVCVLFDNNEKSEFTVKALSKGGLTLCL